MAFLVGYLIAVFSFIMRDVLLSYAPEFLAQLRGVSAAAVDEIWFAFLCLWKMVTGIFLLVAVALSSWWRAF